MQSTNCEPAHMCNGIEMSTQHAGHSSRNLPDGSSHASKGRMPLLSCLIGPVSLGSCRLRANACQPGRVTTCITRDGRAEHAGLLSTGRLKVPEKADHPERSRHARSQEALRPRGCVPHNLLYRAWHELCTCNADGLTGPLRRHEDAPGRQDAHRGSATWVRRASFVQWWPQAPRTTIARHDGGEPGTRRISNHKGLSPVWSALREIPCPLPDPTTSQSEPFTTSTACTPCTPCPPTRRWSRCAAAFDECRSRRAARASVAPQLVRVVPGSGKHGSRASDK